MSSQPPRTIEQVRATILPMPFAATMQLEIESAADGVGVVSMPLSDSVTYDGAAFAAMAVGVVADVAAGAATLSMLPADQMTLTGGIDTTITASTAGTRLTARAELRERDGTTLIFDAVATVQGPDREATNCGTAVITMRVPRPAQT